MSKFNEKVEGELIRFYEYLLTREATTREAAHDLGIYPPNLCRYKAKYIQEKVLIETGKRRCCVTGFESITLTTNLEKVAMYHSRQPQLKLAI